ncbi:MAG: hypothetical protein RI911_148 [Candidatus Parcubacteria bacterium]|jgi:hypothetical protein
MNISKVILIVAGALAVFGGFFWWATGRFVDTPEAWPGALKQFVKGDTEPEISEYRDHVTEAFKQGKFELAGKIADEKTEQLMLGETGFQSLSNSEVHAKFYNAKDVTERVEAVRAVKGFYKLSQNDIDRSRHIESMFHFIHTAWEPEVVNEVFTGEPFGHLKSPQGVATSVRNLAQFSNSLHPTTGAYFRIANWHMNALRDFSPWTSTEQQKIAAKTNADALISLIEVTNTLHQTEMKMRADNKLGFLVKSNYLFWQSTIFSYIGVVYPEYFANSKQRIKEHEEYYETSTTAQGSKNELLAFRLPYAYEVFARAQLYRNKGSKLSPKEIEEWKGEIRWALNNLIRHVERNPEMHRGGILSKLREMGRDKETNNYKSVLRLTELCEPYKVFLEKYAGWTFEK